ncbi:uncharacterized protein V1518DRAFT_420418 [Limtongia smithiae]|uniref:uncharacterized protein n=1 Tax=Limtongia smithiae TaxID=1125753 RepID=UPI0034D00ECD
MVCLAATAASLLGLMAAAHAAPTASAPGASTQCQWTLAVSIAERYSALGLNSDVLLPPDEYAQLCYTAELRADFCARQRHGDNTFVDAKTNLRLGDITGPTCRNSLTYQLAAVKNEEEENDSFTRTVLSVWISYGLAKAEGRAFFLDDTDWAYGKWTDYFDPVPDEQCVRPPLDVVHPCPHAAAHLVISSATQHWALRDTFDDANTRPERSEFDAVEDDTAAQVRRLNTIKMARTGHDALWRLRPGIAQRGPERAQRAVSSIPPTQVRLASTQAETARAAESGSACVGVHFGGPRNEAAPRQPRTADSYSRWARYHRALRDIHIRNRLEALRAPAPATEAKLAVRLTTDNTDLVLSLYSVVNRPVLRSSVGATSEEPFGGDGEADEDEDEDEDEEQVLQYARAQRREVALAAIRDVLAMDECRYVACDTRTATCLALMVMRVGAAEKQWANVEPAVQWTGSSWAL